MVTASRSESAHLDQLKVSLCGISSAAWRRLLVPAATSIANLPYITQVDMAEGRISLGLAPLEPAISERIKIPL